MAKSSVLIVDDHQVTCQLLVKLVGLHGHHGACVMNGPDALAFLAANPVDLVILDMMMPEMNGVEVLRRLRAGGPNANVPVLAYSATADYRDDALREGAQEYLLKGQMGWERLEAAMSKYLNGQPSEP